MATVLFLSVLVHFNFQFRVLLPSGFSVYYSLSPHSKIPHQQNIYFVLCWSSRIQNSVWVSLNTFSGNDIVSTFANWMPISGYHCYSLLNITKWQCSWKLLLLTRKISTCLLHSRFQIFLTAFTQCWNSNNLSSFLTVSIQPILPVLHWNYLSVFEPSFYLIT